jgi:LPXTG-site transpeptidase (sortase) family protein
MNPGSDTPFQPISPTAPTGQSALPPIRPANAPDPTRAASANVIRGQLNQILNADAQPNATISHSSQPMIARPAASQTTDNNAKSTYYQTHAPTSDTSNLHADDQIASAAATIAARQAEEAAIAEAHRRYHSAWQQYYQKYYERYYLAALEQQRSQFAKQQASVNAQSQTLTQQEAMNELRTDLLSKVKQSAKKVRKSRHFIPAICALVVILLALLIQYNGLISAQVASFVSPGDTTDQNIIVGTGTSQPIGAEPRIIIPKINVNAPVVYGLTDLGENSSQKALESGVIHYPIQGASASPGQNGNTVILGHSSADWFEPGNYKFIFVQLNRLSAGDLFYLDYQSVRYTYRVSSTEIINPDQVGSLAIGDDKPYATLITCDPPGTALRRLVVRAEQISPDPSAATSQNDTDVKATVSGDIVGNPPTLFERIFGGK